MTFSTGTRVAWKSVQWLSYFTLGWKQISNPTFHISCSVWVKFKADHTMQISCCEICENWCSENHTSFIAVNEILLVHIFYNFCPIWTEHNIGDVHKNLASDCKFCKNWLSESRILLWEINTVNFCPDFPHLLSTLVKIGMLLGICKFCHSKKSLKTQRIKN